VAQVKITFQRYYPNSNSPGTFVNPVKPPTQFLVGVDESQVIWSQENKSFMVDITGALPGGGGSGFQFTNFDATIQTYYVQLDNVKYYIYNSRKTSVADELGYFLFYVNPNHIVPQYKKDKTPKKTLVGWEIQHWGNSLTELAVTGVSGGMHRINDMGVDTPLTKDQTVRDSTAWKRLEALRQIYYNDQAVRNQEVTSLWSMIYQGRCYIGTFSSFSGPEEVADQPYQLAYSFVFQIEQEPSFPLTKNGNN
jgi:hypothetical protein